MLFLKVTIDLNASFGIRYDMEHEWTSQEDELIHKRNHDWAPTYVPKKPRGVQPSDESECIRYSLHGIT